MGSRPSCSERGSREVADALTRAVAARSELLGKVRVTPCECLGPCFDGPNLVVYPEGVWYGGVSADDVDELVDSHLVGGRPVDRLRLDLSDD